MIHGVPAIGDVGQDDGDEEGDVEHRLEREQTAATVGNRQRALQVSVGGIVGRRVPSRDEEENEDDEHRADAAGQMPRA